MSGQRLPAAYPRWEPVFVTSTPWAAPSLAGAAPDYRWEGALIGATALGLFGAVLGDGMCELDNCASAVFLFGLGGAVAGGVTGGLIGSMFPKGHRDSPDP